MSSLQNEIAFCKVFGQQLERLDKSYLRRLTIFKFDHSYLCCSCKDVSTLECFVLKKIVVFRY